MAWVAAAGTGGVGGNCCAGFRRLAAGAAGVRCEMRLDVHFTN